MVTYVAQPYPIEIDGRGYITDLQGKEFQRRSVQTAFDQSNADHPYSPTGVWRRTVESWHLGMGQSRYDREASNPYRYWDSLGIDPWTKWQVSLLNECDLLTAWPVGNFFGLTEMQTTGTEQFVWYLNQTLRVSKRNTPLPSDTPANYFEIANPHGANWIEACNMRGHGGRVMLIDTQAYVYTVNSNGVLKELTRASWDFGNTKVYANLHIVAAVNGRYLAAGNGELYDIQYTPDRGAQGPETAVAVMFDQRFDYMTPTTIAEGRNCAYLGYSDGDIYRVNMKSDGTGFAPPVKTASMPDGEGVRSMLSYMGYVIIGTTHGLRFAIPDTNGDITYGPLIPIDTGCSGLTAHDRFVWFGIGCYFKWYTNPATGHRMQGLGRVDLANFTAPLVPAYASDLMVDMPAGVETNNTIWKTGPIYTYTYGGFYQNTGRRIFLIPGLGIYCENLNRKVKSGWMEQGAIGYRTGDEKEALSANLRSMPLPQGGSVGLEAKWDNGPWNPIVTESGVGTTGTTNVPLGGQAFSKSEWRVTLTRGDGPQENTTPEFTRFDFKSQPSPGGASEWTIPIMLFDEMDVDGVTYGMDVDAEYERLVALAQSGREFTYNEGSKRWLVHATGHVWRPEKPSASGRGFEGTFYLMAREVL